MAEYKVAATEIGAHKKKLTAEAVDTIVFARAVAAVRIVTDGADWIYYTTDGSVPVVGSSSCHAIPAMAMIDIVDLREQGPASGRTIKMISAGTPTYDISETTP
jgi:hypothetical protein